MVLPPLFLAPTYYYDDYWRMGLEGPPWGYQSVRYGPDLLLVETRTGRIADIIYGAFLLRAGRAFARGAANACPLRVASRPSSPTGGRGKSAGPAPPWGRTDREAVRWGQVRRSPP